MVKLEEEKWASKERKKESVRLRNGKGNIVAGGRVGAGSVGKRLENGKCFPVANLEEKHPGLPRWVSSSVSLLT